jgi:hypothetical protein
MFKKKFDRDDLYNYLPDNHTIGTMAFYKKKFDDKFSDNQYKYFEIISRKEHDDEDSYIKEIVIDELAEQKKLIDKYNSKCENSEPDNHYKVLIELKSKIKLYNE